MKLSDFYANKTEIAHKTLNPRWDEDFVIEVSHDGDIMKHPLEIKYVPLVDDVFLVGHFLCTELLTVGNAIF